jgi:hypothetical protein
MSVKATDPIMMVVPPPPAIGDLADYVQAREGVERLNGRQCHALAWALAMRDGHLPIEAAPVAPVPARRKVGLLEVIVRGVECCDPKVVRLWQVFRLWLAVVLVGVGVVLLFAPWIVKVGIPIACVISLGLGFSMLRGKASVCH